MSTLLLTLLFKRVIKGIKNKYEFNDSLTPKYENALRSMQILANG